MTGRKFYFGTLLLLLLAFLMVSYSAFIPSQNFVHITLEEWVRLGSFTPIILQPGPGGTELRMGPIFAEGADRVELHYTEGFVSNATPPVYELYESGKPLPVGERILPYCGATNEGVETERMSLVLLGSVRPVELRRNMKHANAGIVIFDIEGTHVVYHWRNVSEDVALQALEESIMLVSEGDINVISSFDQKLGERRKSSGGE